VDYPSSQTRSTSTVPDATRTSGSDPRNRNLTSHDVESDVSHVDPVGSLADDWNGDLFQLQPLSQPRTKRYRNEEVRSQNA
jgi:hypothetical protein